MAVSKRLRYEILRRDNHTCRYCGASAPDVPLRVDHVTPVALGGTDTADNLVTSCEPCNSGKTSMPADAALVADVAQDALRWSVAMKQAAEEARAAHHEIELYRDSFDDEWIKWTIGKDKDELPRPDDWRVSIGRFHEAGLPAFLWYEIVPLAMANTKVKPDDKFRYVCGIAWNKVGELQARAKEILQVMEPATVAEPAITDEQFAHGCDVVEHWTRRWREMDPDVCDPTSADAQAFVEHLHRAYLDGQDPDDILQAADLAGGFLSSDLPYYLPKH